VTIQKGRQDFALFATDGAGNQSAVKTFSVTYDNPPVVAFVNPKSLGGISGNTVLSWNITDPDNDPLQNISVAYSRNGGAFETLVSNAAASGTYAFDATNLPESNDYRLRISASDGTVTVSPVISFSIDRTPPSIVSFSVGPSAAKNSFIGTGSAYDSLSGIASVEFSLEQKDGSQKRSDWYEAIVQGGFGNQKTFSIDYPLALSDGVYQIFARAVDFAGNISPEVSRSILIDTTAPRIGSFFATQDGIELDPNDSGDIVIYKNDPFDFAVSLEGDTKSAFLVLDGTSSPLVQDGSDGLWKTSVPLSMNAEADIRITASDNSGNTVVKKYIGALEPEAYGTVRSSDSSGQQAPLAGAKFTVLKLNDQTGQYETFVPNIGASTLASGANGEYRLILPQGTYRLVARMFGYQTEEKDMTLSQSGIVQASFVLPEVKGIMRFVNAILDFFRY